MADAGPIVGIEWVAQRIGDRDVRLVELDVSGAAYDEAHISGAVLWNAYSDLRGGDYLPIGDEQLGALLARSGIAPDTTVVFYGYGDVLGFWLLRSHGHRDVHMLTGSREQWLRELGSESGEPPALPLRAYSIAAGDPGALADRAAVEAALADPACVMLDVRSQAEYAGERFWPSGAPEDRGRAGHIPGAVSVPIDLLRNEDGTFASRAAMRRVLDDAGVGREARIITYCTIGNRAAQAAFALTHLLDYRDVRVYYPSWVEWGKVRGTPVEA